VQTVESVDTDRYAGLWYEIARLPAPLEGRFATDATVSYTAHGQRLEVDKRCRLPSGRERRSVGVAHPVEGTGRAQMEVSLFPSWLRWLPVAWAGEWVIALDSDYQTAVVGAPGRGALCLLSRSPVIDEARYQSMVASAAAQGYTVARLERVQHRAVTAVPAPA
jgi:apolipoprotein D and lipocalin family protein